MKSAWMRRASAIIGAVVALAAPAVAGQEPLERARRSYNGGRFDEAIEAAEQARADPARAAPAAVVLARAHLERFRATGDAGDLLAGRSALRDLAVGRLTARERTEWEIGLAESLYLEGRPGPAAELFGRLLDRARSSVEPPHYDRLLSWWAMSVERDHDQRSPGERAAAYRRILRRMEDEARRSPPSAAALYWLVAAARGAGELDRAWGVAVAGWVVAAATGAGARLRQDLDRLMLQAVIPDLARRQTGARTDTREAVDAMATLAARWEEIKGDWGGPDEEER